VQHQCHDFEKIKAWAMAPGRAAIMANGVKSFHNPIMDEALYEKNGAVTPTSLNGSHEVVTGTRLNPNIVAAARVLG